MNEEPSFSVNDQIEIEEYLPHWESEATSVGPAISFDGTVEQLYGYVSAKFPDQLSEIFDLDIMREPIREEEEGIDELALDKRTDFSGSQYKCKKRDAVLRRIKEGIRYLRSVRGRPQLPRNGSGRVSCSYRSGIYWYNKVSSLFYSPIVGPMPPILSELLYKIRSNGWFLDSQKAVRFLTLSVLLPMVQSFSPSVAIPA